MTKYRIETAVGIFVLAGLACVAYLTIHLGKVELFGGNTYTINARFNDVTGLVAGAEVQMAGVTIGHVDSIHLRPEDKTALVSMQIQKDVPLDEDAIASIKTSGLIGDKYIKISPGGSDVPLAPGALLTDTESSVDLTDLIGKYIFGGVK
ncbi:outer membrane lipid asymmetry maintenance protein MlaD [Desulfovibrio inopinatus]|uniref:outer membrane lipid asymmetry maintenance protein MlaD n=1 Tax=Desulfovibrio inopinatus TaxID=102109 RepID=UPI000411068E|nr:outer membrane lipid asymmetry maintenance protein MlaD [Desulfovibrio inopinatus]